MIFKSYILDQNIELLKNKIFLFYGENQGLKTEFKKNIKRKNKTKEIINLFQDDIVKDKNILIKEVNNKSLFQKEKVIFVNQANDKIFDILEIIDKYIDNERIFIFSDALDKKSKLRNYFEKSKEYGITACYDDNEITIRKIVTNKLKTYNGLTPDIINIIIQNSGLNRDKVNNEIEKIKSCFLDKQIHPEKLDLLLNVKMNDDFSVLKDEALSGNKIKTNMLLSDTVFETENNIYYLNLINQRINKLYEIDRLKQKNYNIETLISNLKPPIFWKDKPKLIEQSKKWNKEKLKKALDKTYSIEVEIKSNTSIRKNLLIKNLLVDLCTSASAA